MPQPLASYTIGFPLIVLQSVDSTNNYALGRIHAGLAQHGEAVFAHEQLAGKGQRGRQWTSEKDANIILSIVVNPHPIGITEQFQLSACVAAAIHEFLTTIIGGDCKIKWPNDLYWQDRKTGGILIESVIGGSATVNYTSGSKWQWAVIGTGINVNQVSFPKELPNPVSLKQITGKTFDCIALAKTLCEYIDHRYHQLLNEGFKPIFTYYQQHLYKKNRVVKFKKDNRIFEATVRSVTPLGELVIFHTMEETIPFGSIEWMI